MSAHECLWTSKMLTIFFYKLFLIKKQNKSLFASDLATLVSFCHEQEICRMFLYTSLVE